MLGAVTPILRMFDEAKAMEFYVDFLGFAVNWSHRFSPDLPLYLQLSKGDCVLHLTEHHGDACPGAALRIACDDLEAWQVALLAKGYGYARPGIEDTPWDTREMTIMDPFGNRLVFVATVRPLT